MDPDIFNKSEIIFFDKLRIKTLYEIRWILGENVEKEITQLESWFVDQIDPIELSGSEDFEVMYDKAFEENCFLMSKSIGISIREVKKFTVTEFYSVITYMKKYKKKY